ncbi:MAG: exodeoxyribonuclease VII large subunit [Candidatus Rokuibacteriota bacterium]|nr:MAG: exodeoxyribonuclease VII large subunit [Candidatus Rokubacteria bacterium]
MTAERAVLTVSALTIELRAVLEERFPAVWVEGEISNFRLYGSGHAYFTLKDAEAQLRCVLFRNRGRRIKFEPADGLHVMAFGSVEVYAQRGEYQLVVELLEPKGLGALQLAFEQLKARLTLEGLFDPARKRELPRFPRKIGIVTSPSGAAIRDMLRVIGRRFGELHIVIAPAKVQGEGAAEEIAQGLRDLNALGDVDVIIVGRGGGSLEDLWAFNEEVVARAICASKAPVISAVGHEVDFTIADFVADLRAPTPSAAAELVVREKQAVVDALDDLARRLQRAAHRPLSDLERRVDELGLRLRRGMHADWRRAAHRVELAMAALRASSPVARVSNGRHRLERLEAQLRNEIRHALDQARHHLGEAAGRLDSLSPLAVLGRGYSLTRTPDGRIVRSARQVGAGDDVRVLLHEGALDCRVSATKEHDDRPQV